MTCGWDVLAPIFYLKCLYALFSCFRSLGNEFVAGTQNLRNSFSLRNIVYKIILKYTIVMNLGEITHEGTVIIG